MSSNPQRSFAGGEIAPALHARADLARYAIGLRTCRNMVVMRAGGATKRPGTKFVDTVGVSPGYVLTLTATASVVASQTAGIVAVLTDWLGNPVTAFPCTFETDDPSIATVADTDSRTATLTGVADGTVHVRARIAALGDLVSNDCVVTVSDFYVLHAFVASGTFVVTHAGTADHLMIGGGGSGGSVDGGGVGAGGGGAGELIHELGVAHAVGSYPVIIGGGGIAPFADHTIAGGVFGVLPGSNGTATTFKGRTARGGGGGGGADATLLRRGRDGGSGGGGASAGDGAPPPGAFDGGLATASAPGIGSNGGGGDNVSTSVGAGGGGASGSGSIGIGGAGASINITGAPFTFARGGAAVEGPGVNGAANTGSGGQGGGQMTNSNGGNGGSGVVYIRYQASTGLVATGGIITTFPL